jgi:hypothetical protein
MLEMILFSSQTIFRPAAEHAEIDGNNFGIFVNFL